MVRLIRINKAISDSGICSRRKAEELIFQKRVTVNGITVNSLSVYVDLSKDLIAVDGENLKTQSKIYILLNKPAGFISSTKDQKGRKTVLDLIKVNKRIYPIGRLDYNTTGVLLLSNDGEFSNLLLHPKNRIPRVYKVKLNIEAELSKLKKLVDGIYLEDKKSRFEKIHQISRIDKTQFLVECFEGRNHFVKKMFQKIGIKVIKLHRQSFGIFNDDIPIGSYRFISEKEISKLRELYA